MNNIIKLVTTLIFIFLFSCNLFIDLPIDEKITFLNEKPIYLSIDDNDNGVISYSNKIFRIEKLNINFFDLDLSDRNKNYPLKSTFYSSNKNGDFLLIYSRDIHYDQVELAVVGLPPLIYPFYSAKFFKNGSKELSNNEIFTTTDGNHKINLFDNNDYILFLENKERYSLYNIELFNYKNNSLSKTTLINDITLSKNNTNLSMKEGKGYFYFETNNKYNLFLIDAFNRTEQKLEEELNTKDFNVYKIFLDDIGNGSILFYSKDNKIYIQKFSNFIKITDKEFIFDYKDKELIDYRVPINNIFINSEGNGLFFFKNLKDNYTYFNKLVNFKLESKNYRLINSIKYTLLTYSINNKGNGFIILSNGSSFILKKMINFEIDK
ncbi:MAG: hypothetical protein U0457_16165 [Candidatus Sericytochromatia bacterium]